MSTFTDLITSDDAFFLSLFTPVYTGSVAVQETMKPVHKSEDLEKKRKAEGDEANNKPSKHPRLTKTTAKNGKDQALINLTKSTVNRKKSGANQLTAKNGKDQGSATTRPPWKPCWFYFLKNLNKLYFSFDV